MNITDSIRDFINNLRENRVDISGITIELPYLARRQIAHEEELRYPNTVYADNFRGREVFQVHGVKINRLKSETDAILKAELERLEERTKELKEQLGIE